MEFSLRILGLNKIYHGLDLLGARAPRVGQQAIHSALVKAKNSARTYPPQPVGSKYRRTKTYFNSFQVIKIPDGWSLQSDATDPRGRAYTVFVGGDDKGGGMAWNTKHWPVIREEVDAVVDDLVVVMEQDMQDLVNSIFAAGGP